jgi:outer membrane protein OmpA-like peptidoglycan-associated protein
MRVTLMLSLLLIAVGAAAATPAYMDPWSPESEAAAEAAVSRLGAQRALALRSTVLTIVGVQQGVVASVSQLHEAMTALNAQENDLEIHVNLPADVLFDFDKAGIRPDAAKALAFLATIIRANPKGRTRLEGHTDAVGNEKYNQSLSERRAESVKVWLVKNESLDAPKLLTKGWGKTKPIAPNDTEANRQKNRRLEAIVEKGPRA